MTTPLPPNAQPQQPSSSQPPVHPQKRVGTGGRHKVSATASPQFSSGQAISSQPQKSLAERSATSTSYPAGDVETPRQNPPGQMEVLHRQLTTQIADFWVRDQVSILHKIMADPDLAAKMGISIKVQLPGTDTPVQVYPIIRGPDALTDEDRTRCEELLQRSSAGLNEKIEQQKPVNDLFGEYVETRNQFIALGEELHPDNFSWQPIYGHILRTAINETIETEGVELIFIKEQPDSSKTLSRKALHELALYDQEKPEEEEEEEEEGVETPASQEIKRPKGKSALKNSTVEFYVSASEADIARHRTNMQHLESQEPDGV